MPGGGEGTILPRLCSQPGERRPGPGALPTARPPPGSLHPHRARRWLCLARHQAQGRGPGAQWALQSLAGSVPREAPRPRQGLGIPGRAPLDAVWATRRVGGPAEWREALVSPTPSSVPARSPAAYNGVPSPEGLSGGWGNGHLSCARGPPGTSAGHRPEGDRAQRGVWSPENSPAAVRAPTRCFAMCCWPWPGSQGLSPRPRAVVPPDPPGAGVAARWSQLAGCGEKVVSGGLGVSARNGWTGRTRRES